jgi:beta-ureidopropionase / N-carbamoyl-L-amino-acid hydrolase
MSVISIPKVNGDRLVQKLATLAQIGKLPNGGVRRISYTPEDLLARQLVCEWMSEAGMTVSIDAAGNIIGTYAGARSAAALATGSHIDTVPTGGRYDGALGVLAGVEVVQTLRDNNITLNHPVKVIVFTDEEGGMIGSKAMAGRTVSDPEYYRRDDGTPIQSCLERIGGDWSALITAKRTSADLAAYVELHVEQGGILEASGKQIGIVEGIVSMNRAAIAITGRSNHAGTTPMHLRQDALVVAAHIVLAVERLAKETPGQQVATIGILNVSPNAANIVPGRVDMVLDIRDLSQDHVDQLVKQLQDILNRIAVQTKTDIQLTSTLRVEPTLATPLIQDTIAGVCQTLGLSYCRLPSRAGHDAQEIGRFTNMGMIFVPSYGGVSHTEDEYTSPEQCIHGANVLLRTLTRLDAVL